MKVTKDQIHEDLRSSLGKLKIYNFLGSRKWGFPVIDYVLKLEAKKGINIDGLHSEEQYIERKSGGAAIRCRIYRPQNMDQKLPVMLYLHGGGYAVGYPEQSAAFYAKIIKTRPCIIVAPAYRKSLQAPYPAALDDCYDTLLWINENAEKLQAIPGQTIVAGHSAGGGLTAAVTLKARDTQEAPIAFQLPIYPMIDDLQANESSKLRTPVWDARSNALGWGFYLAGLKKQGAEIPAYAAPARNQDYSNFPPTITFVGDMEPFRDETIAYVEQLRKAGIPVKFKRFPGCFHAFETVLPDAAISKEASAFVMDSYAEYYDQYITLPA